MINDHLTAAAPSHHEVALATTRLRAHAVKRHGLTVRPLNEADPAAWAPVMAELATNAVGEYGATRHAFVAEFHAVRAAQSH